MACLRKLPFHSNVCEKIIKLFFALQTLDENNVGVKISKFDPHKIYFVLCQVPGATAISFNVDKG